MSEWVVDFDQVWKRYPPLKDKPGFKELFVNFHRFMKRREEDHCFYALKDLTLKIGRGECVGIIGKNGAGKSTLLSLMLGTLLPSKGKVTVTDRVTPLLELGAGFHPDLTGIENVTLNGILLGLTREDILKRVPSIIEFSELQEFADVPVRTYSSGMYLRLAFSVAVHADPKILIIDEVLSVGDEGFQRKSKQIMLNLIKSGVTTVLVSHNLDVIQDTCQRVVWIDHGQIVAEGEPGRVTEMYRKGVIQATEKP